MEKLGNLLLELQDRAHELARKAESHETLELARLVEDLCEVLRTGQEAGSNG